MEPALGEHLVVGGRMIDAADGVGQHRAGSQNHGISAGYRTRFFKQLVECSFFLAHENATEITQPYSRRVHYVAAADCAVVCSMMA